MILQCQGCNKVKRFGEWIEVPEELCKIMEDIKVIKMLCPQCQGNVLLMPSLGEAVLKRSGTDVIDTVSFA